MGPVWYTARTDLRTDRWRTAGLALLVALVGGAVLALAAGTSRTATAPDRYSASVGADYDLTLEQFDGRPRTAEIARLPAVSAVDTATFVFGGLLDPEGGAPLDGLIFAGTMQAFGGRIVEGRAAEPGAVGEFVASRSWATTAGTDVGGRFELVTLSQQLADQRGFDVETPDGPALTSTLVGIFDGPNELQDQFPVALFPQSLLDAGDVGVSATTGVVALAPGSTAADLRSQLDGLPGTFGIDPLEWVPADVRSAVQAQAQGLAVVTVVVGLAALAVLGQLLTRRTRRPLTQQRTLRSLGLIGRQILAEPVSAAAVPIVAGCVGAATVAFMGSGLFPTGFAAAVEPSPGLRVDALVQGIGAVLLGAVLLGWVALVRSRDRTRRTHARPDTGRFVGRLGGGPLATGTRFALTRTVDDPASPTPIAGLAAVLVALVAAVTFGASLDRFLDQPTRYGYNFDFATGQGGDAVPAELQTFLEEDRDVVDVTLYGTELATVGADSLDVTGMQTVRGELEPQLLSGRLARRPDEITLGAVASRRYGAAVGAGLVVAGEGGEHRFVVTGIAVVPSVEGGDGVGEGAIVTLEGLRRIAPDASLGVAAVRVRPGSDVADRVERAMGIAVGLPDQPPTVLNLSRIRSTPYAVVGSLAALTLLSVGHQLVLTARRRRRELAVLRALGADGRWVTRVLHSHALVLAGLTAAVATPIGVAIGRVAYGAFIDRVGADRGADVPLLALGAGLVGLLLVVSVLAVVPAWRARREVPARALAVE